MKPGGARQSQLEARWRQTGPGGILLVQVVNNWYGTTTIARWQSWYQVETPGVMNGSVHSVQVVHAGVHGHNIKAGWRNTGSWPSTATSLFLLLYDCNKVS